MKILNHFLDLPKISPQKAENGPWLRIWPQKFLVILTSYKFIKANISGWRQEGFDLRPFCSNRTKQNAKQDAGSE